MSSRSNEKTLAGEEKCNAEWGRISRKKKKNSPQEKREWSSKKKKHSRFAGEEHPLRTGSFGAEGGGEKMRKEPYQHKKENF